MAHNYRVCALLSHTLRPFRGGSFSGNPFRVCTLFMCVPAYPSPAQCEALGPCGSTFILCKPYIIHCLLHRFRFSPVARSPNAAVDKRTGAKSGLTSALRFRRYPQTMAGTLSSSRKKFVFVVEKFKHTYKEPG